jgi:gamma-glutamyl hercynylcysteine S-oxide synthase
MPATQALVEVQHNLLTRLADARSQTDRLFQIVRPEALYKRPIPERHRIVFYIGHLEAFDWNLLSARVAGLKPFHPEFDRLFAFGIDPVDGGLPSDQPGDWPSLLEIRRYVERVRCSLDAALEKFGEATLLHVAIEHRLMHAETLAYMLHQLPLEDKARQPIQSQFSAGPVESGMVEIPSGQTTLGLSRDAASFGWDNEYEAHPVDVPEFAIDQYKVTNGQYQQFMEAGGYQDRSLWSPDDWIWRTEQNITQPVFWRRRNGSWFYRRMFDEIPLPLDWPVYVSHTEAGAYARWAGKTLPSEAQWHRAAEGSRDHNRHGYFDFERWDPSFVNAFPRGESAFPVAGLFGNGWEWTSTAFAPFDGFRPFSFYPGYSASFFDGKHYVIKGGSPRTEACMLRLSFRNWFQPHYQYVYAGFRLVAE